MIIKLENVTKTLAGHKVLDQMSLEIEEGMTVVIIGRSGCGKSVTLKHIEGIMRPDAGKVYLFGQDILRLNEKELNALRMRMSLVFQGGALFDSMTVGENVGFNLIEHQRMEGKALLERIEESLCMVDLCGVANLMPAELSGGMRKRVALARAICTRPEVILYDEPTTGVDPITADGINELIKNLHDKLKVTSIVVTHDMKSAYKVADRIAMLYNGKIIADGTPEQIQNSDNPVVHQFINGLAQGPITETIERPKIQY
jgi:phospholipid/cholesterol/gamma-HCH transport system ATP-binding protein